ncbi:porin [Noviherbaspirillum sp.]|uniref:porin n=1 Tax=Noviherbaspirillum sp. TaxID=1926288 RepID=UPI002B4A293D|nr:porin [Noviherbaspirillum sp.]HJV82379.1 porin [Noviherbaspirillum sp.]
MKKSFLALAVLGAFAGAASAQSSVNIYGLIDTGIVGESGGAAGSVTKMTSGVTAGSRLGFRGKEDLGGGLSAQFVLEAGLLTDTGASAQGGLLFGRQAFMGLGGGYGTVLLGRQYTPIHLVLSGVADPFQAGWAGNAGNLIPRPQGSRTNNMVRYATPNVNGFSAEVAYGLGETAGNNSANRALGGAVGYASGPLTVRLGYHNVNNAAATDSAKNTLLAGTYDFKPVKMHLAYGINKGAGVVDNRDMLIGATIPFGASKVLASYIRKDDKSGANADANQFALGYMYSLSKRTDLYLAYARISNKNGAAYTVGNATESGTGNKAYNVGVRHSF